MATDLRQQLPLEFHYLAPALRFFPDGLPDEEDVIDAVESLSFLQKTELKLVAEEIGRRRDLLTIQTRLIRGEFSNSVSFRLWALIDVLITLGHTCRDPNNPYDEAMILRLLEEAKQGSINVLIKELLEVTTRERAYAAAIKALDNVPEDDLGLRAHLTLHPFGPMETTLDWIERQVARKPKARLGVVAALSGLPWPRLKSWLDSGPPLQTIALEALRAFVRDPEATPGKCPDHVRLSDAPPEAELMRILSGCAASNPSSRRTVERVLKRIRKLRR